MHHDQGNNDLLPGLDRLLAAIDRQAAHRRRAESGYACIGLHCPTNPQNVGTALRAASCFGAAFFAIEGARFRKTSTDVKHEYMATPVIEVESLAKIVPHHCVPVAVELLPGAISLPDYEHPRQAFYVFGGEHETLGRKVTDWCRDVISIPTQGSLNLGICVNIVLYDRLVKQLRNPPAGRYGNRPQPRD